MALAQHVQPHEIQSRLHALGVTEEQLREVAMKGYDAKKSTTPFHPPSSPGFYQWSEMVVGLRQIYVPLKWVPSDVGGFSTVVSPDGAVAIAVATGSDRTGRPGLPDPVTRYPRGAMTHAAIEINQQTALDLETGVTILPDAPESKKRVTWWLLVNTRHDEIRFELSCPNRIGDDGRIDSWSERIVFAPINVEPTITMLPDEPDPQPIDVRVERLR
jgi:hypothetical protein